MTQYLFWISAEGDGNDIPMMKIFPLSFLGKFYINNCLYFISIVYQHNVLTFPPQGTKYVHCFKLFVCKLPGHSSHFSQDMTRRKLYFKIHATFPSLQVQGLQAASLIFESRRTRHLQGYLYTKTCLKLVTRVDMHTRPFIFWEAFWRWWFNTWKYLYFLEETYILSSKAHTIWGL